MLFRRVWALRGPNVWARFPVLEVVLDLSPLRDRPVDEIPGFAERLRGRLPSLGGVEEPDPARGLGLATLELQRLAGSAVAYLGERPTSEPGVVKFAIEYEEEAIVREALESARQLCLSAWDDTPFDLAAEVARLKEIAEDVRLGPSTRSIVEAARGRGIPARRLGTGSLVMLGQGARQRRIRTAETDRTGALAEAIAQDKDLTKVLLQAVGVPIPEGRPVEDAEDAWLAAESIGVPVVVKPLDGNHGRGVATDLTTREQVVAAFDAAKQEGSRILVEKFIKGADYRLLVIGGKLVAAARRDPAHVVGDGTSTVAQLVEAVNRDPRRGEGHASVLTRIRLDDPIARAVLLEQGHSPDSVPPAGSRVLIRRNANLSTGGTAEDVTDRVHPDVAARAVDAARVIGLDIAGVDLVAEDVDRPLEQAGAAVVEVNAGPGLRMHLEPSTGTPRAVGRAIVDMLFPAGEDGRIPVVAVTGTNGKTTVSRMIAHVLAASGRRVGLTCTDGIYVEGRRIVAWDCSGPQSARSVLLNPAVDAAVLETARGGIIREGFGFDLCDVAVVTNIGEGDHVGLRGIETLEELAEVKRTVVTVVDPNGAVVLNGSDPLVSAMAGHASAPVTFFSSDPDSPILLDHARAGGRTVSVREGMVIVLEGGEAFPLVAIHRVRPTRDGRVAFQVENALAAAASAWALGIEPGVIADALASFDSDADQVPGRFNVLEHAGATVIVDYAHNPSALRALARALDAFPPGRRTMVYSAAGDRRDVDIVRQGEILGDGFDRVILYEDGANYHRGEGETLALLRQGLAAGRRVAEAVEIRGESAAVDLALDGLARDEVVVIGPESIEETLARVRRRLDGLSSARQHDSKNTLPS